jgi:hypothetical protein
VQLVETLEVQAIRVECAIGQRAHS